MKVSEDLSWTPTKAEAEMWTETTYTAKFKAKVFTLTVATNNTTDSNQSYIFDITGDAVDGTHIHLEIALGAQDSKTIVGLPAGTYRITDQQGWSWRDSAQSKTVTITDTAPEIQVFHYAAANVNEIYWLNGYGNEQIPGGTARKKK